MANDNRKNSPENSKKGFPGGFLVLVLIAIMVILSIQNFSNAKTSRVSFSHEVEHLVNLDLLKKEESRKIALNDNLVTFSGQFKDRKSEEAIKRYRYLELLNQHHLLVGEKESLNHDLLALRQNVKEAADWFLHITGTPIPEGGFWVVGNLYDTAGQSNSVIITALSKKEMLSLPELKAHFAKIYQTGTDAELKAFNQQFLLLLQEFRSPVLGIGNEQMKLSLKNIQDKIAGASALPKAEQLALYQTSFTEMTEIVSELASESSGVRLVALRSVRNYQEDVQRYRQVTEELERNSAQLSKARSAVATVIWYFNNKELSTAALEKQEPDLYDQWFAQAKQQWENFETNRGALFKAPDQPRNTVLDRTFKSEEPAPNYFGYFLTILPVLLVVFLLYFVFSKQMKGMGGTGGAMSFGKSPARLMTKENNKTSFKDVAGCEEAKEELQEVVDFLKDPGKFTALGARIPKGVLLIGSPGTGKTLIAKAVAGEADRPFFSISGSDFVEMFVGVGASRIRDMFDQAKKNAPCIIFMDEIDAVGRHRGAGVGGGHDEREQTLNQLLVEMDGFDTSEGVILIAATNRPDVLDKALLRPGRFDRRIILDLPDVKGRFEILKVHGRKIKLDASVDLMSIARNTPGASGADLENILNEAALLAARKGRSAVTKSDAEEACDKVRYGKERRSLEVDQNEKKTTAIHESGHAIVALMVKYADPVDKVTIIPRGLSLGATHFMPKKNRVSYWKKEILDQLAVLMGGRVAEELFVGDVSSGAQMDFSQATKLVRSMVCEWGMTDDLGPVAYDERSEGGSYLGVSNYHEKTYSEATAQKIDEKVLEILEAAYKQATEILTTHKEMVLLMTEMLMEFETLFKEDIDEILKGTWDAEKKRKRVKAQEDLQKKVPPPPPELSKSNEIPPNPLPSF